MNSQQRRVFDLSAVVPTGTRLWLALVVAVGALLPAQRGRGAQEQSQHWPEGDGHPAVVVLVANCSDGSRHGVNAAFHAGDGYFITTYHSFPDFDRFHILTPAGARAPVTSVAAADRARDILVFRAEPAPAGLGTLRFAKRSPSPRTTVHSIGFPKYTYERKAIEVLGHWSIPDWGGLLVLDAMPEAGVSGGPVLDAKDRVVGMIFGGKIRLEDGPEPGPWTHAVAAADIAQVLSAARSARHPEEGSLEEWLRSSRDPVASLRQQVHGARSEGDWESCDLALSRHLAYAPGDARAWALLAAVRTGLRRFEAAGTALLTAVALDQDDADVQFRLGEFLEARGETLAASKAYARSAAAPAAARTYWELSTIGNAAAHHARLAKAEGRDAEALASLERTLAIFPYHAEDHRRRGDALVAIGRYDDALLAYDESVALRRGRRGIGLRVVLAEAMGGNGGGALAGARGLVEADGANALARFLLAILAARFDEKRECRAQREALETLDPALGRRLDGILSNGKPELPPFTLGWNGEITPGKPAVEGSLPGR